MNTDEFLAALQHQMTQGTYDAHLGHAKVEVSGNTVTLLTSNAFSKDWLEGRLHHIIQRTADRIAGRHVTVRYSVRYPDTGGREKAPAPSPPSGLNQDYPGYDRDMPPDCQFAVELVSFDPTSRGFVMTANYAWQFWLPYLGSVPFNLYNVLKSFPGYYRYEQQPEWPSISTLADITANGNRHKIVGRAARKGRKRVVGALEVLEEERIVWTKAYGEGTNIVYTFKVRDQLPLLTPAQVSTLSERLQEKHAREITRANISLREWEQLTLPSLTG